MPFVLIFGINTPDNFLTLLAAILGSLYAFKISLHFKRSINQSVFWALFSTIGSNALFVLSTGGVWYMAQMFCFAFSLASIYYALTKVQWHGHLSLGLWACAVGSRPFTAIYIPILLYLLWEKYNKKYPDSKLMESIIKNLRWAIAPTIIALAYMVLNGLRFGNPLTFGHEYLPEFTQAVNSQFSLVYFKSNLNNLLRLPGVSENGRFLFPAFDGVAFWLVSPIFISSLIYLIRYSIVEKKKNYMLSYGVFTLVLLNLFLILLHKTMGGWHFGNRYTVDLLPYNFLMLMESIRDKKEFTFIDHPLFLFGLTLNTVGTIALFNNWL